MRQLIASTFIIATLLVSCGSTKMTPEEKEKLVSKIENQEYKFTPRSANPMSGKTIQLTGGFSLRVSKDTINCYLPYYGRAYSASPMEGGGIKFLSKKFDYNLTKKKEGMWDAQIVTKDTQSHYKIYLKISDNGYATVSVEDPNRQGISFYGTIE